MPKPTIVLVHGSWADASSWKAVAVELQRQDFTVLAPSNLLRGVAADAAYVASFLAQRTSGPVVLVGHSYGGFVITNAGTWALTCGHWSTWTRSCPTTARRPCRSSAGPGRRSTCPTRPRSWTSSAIRARRRATPRRSSSPTRSTSPSRRTCPRRTAG